MQTCYESFYVPTGFVKKQQLDREEKPIPAAVPGKPAASWLSCTHHYRQLRIQLQAGHMLPFCPARAKAKERELKAQVRKVHSKWRRTSVGLLIITRGKKLGFTVGGGCKPKGRRVSLLHVTRTLCCNSGCSPPTSFLLPSSIYAESASSLQHFEQSRKINTLCFQRSSNADEIYKVSQ